MQQSQHTHLSPKAWLRAAVTMTTLFLLVISFQNCKQVSYVAPDKSAVDLGSTGTPANDPASHTPAAIVQPPTNSVTTPGNQVPSNVMPMTTPFGNGPRMVPGRIEAEDFDNGGEGLAYHDTTPGNGFPVSVYRNSDVDLKPCSDVGGGFAVGIGAAGEWLVYTINVAQSGLYRFDARVATASNVGPMIHMEIDNVNVTGSLVIPYTGAWDTAYATISANNIPLTAGLHRMRIAIESNDVDLNYFQFSEVVNQQVDVSSMMKTTGTAATDGTWNIFNEGYVETPALSFTSADTYRIDVDAYGSIALGVWPKMELRVDGQPQATLDVATTNLTRYSFNVMIPAGPHKIEAAFLNDAYAPPEDRNLYVRRILVNSLPVGL